MKKYISIKHLLDKSRVTFSSKEKIFFICVLFLKLSLNVMYIFYYLHIEKSVINYNITVNFLVFTSFQFELIFLFLLTKLLSNIQFYRHQYLSIMILAVLELTTFIIKFIDRSIILFFRNLTINISFSFLKSLLAIYAKELMENKYYSPYKACYIFGLFNLLIITIAYIISSFIPCNKLLCYVKYNDQKYFAHFLTIFNFSGLFFLFIFILKAVISVLHYIVIHDFSVCHSIFIIQFHQNILGILLKTNNALLTFILIVLFLGINTFFISIFLEIIELNICNISYNTKKNIQGRIIDDNNYYMIEMKQYKDDDVEEEEKEEEDGSKNKNNYI